MTEAEATKLLADGLLLVTAVTSLIPTLAANLSAIKAGLANDNADDLSAQIAATHGQIQAMADKLAALKTA